jgi:hypothetical protein
MLILECSQGCYGRMGGRKEGRKEGRTDGSVTISLRNFVGEGIINSLIKTKSLSFEGMTLNSAVSLMKYDLNKHF